MHTHKNYKKQDFFTNSGKWELSIEANDKARNQLKNSFTCSKK